MTFKVDMYLKAGKRTPGWTGSPVDILLPQFSTCIIVSSGISQDVSDLDRRRVRLLRQVCKNDARLRKSKSKEKVLRLDGRVMYGPGGLIAFVSYVRIKFAHAGIVPEDLPIALWRCLCPDTIGEPFSKDSSPR